VENFISKMDKRIKFLFIGLIGLLLVILISLFSTIGSKQALLQEYTSTKENLTRERESLVQKINSVMEEKRRLEERYSKMQADMDRISKERDDLQKKYEVAAKEREGLIEKLRQKKPAAEEVAIPATEDAYWAKILKEKAGLEMQVASLREELNNLKIVSDEVKRNQVASDLEMKNLSREKQDLENRMSFNDKMTDSLSSELVREKNDKRALLDELRALKNEHSALLSQLRSLSSQKASLETKLAQAEQARAALEKRIGSMNDMLEYKISEVMDIKKDLEQIGEGAEVTKPMQKGSVELPAIIVRSQPEPASTAPSGVYIGKVLAVNKDNNFIVIDIGEEQGLQPGTSFNVYQGDNKVATVEVIQIRKNVSACDIKQASGPINVGDEVR
jgi:predicted nuclease with TOPRIM domain